MALALLPGVLRVLGFADDWQNTCANDVLSSLEKWPISSCSTRSDVFPIYSGGAEGRA